MVFAGYACSPGDRLRNRNAVGPWYAVNDMAILRCAENYLRVTGDFAWLKKSIGDKRCLEHLTVHALYWKTLDKTGKMGLPTMGRWITLLEVDQHLHSTRSQA